MKEQRIGLATFLPLDSIQSKPANERYRSLVKGARLAIDCIQFESILEPVFQYVCGSALICDTLEIARNICYDRGQKVKAVTLDGTVIHKAGLITGGQSDQLAASAHRWEEKEVAELHRTKEKLEMELSELNRRRRKLQPESTVAAELSGLETRLRSLTDDLAATVRKLASIEEEFAHVEQEIASWEKKNSLVSKNISKLDAERTKVDMAIVKMEELAFKELCKDIGVSTIREYEGSILKMAQETTEKRLQFANLKSKLQSE